MPKRIVECTVCQGRVSIKGCVEVQSRETRETFYVCDYCYTSDEDWPATDWIISMFV